MITRTAIFCQVMPEKNLGQTFLSPKKLTKNKICEFTHLYSFASKTLLTLGFLDHSDHISVAIPIVYEEYLIHLLGKVSNKIKQDQNDQ